MITSKSILTEANKQWIVNNCSKFTALEIANYFGVTQQVVNSFCRRKSLKPKKSEYHSKNEIIEDGMFFNVDYYYRNQTVTL